jgi:hypothetical protein
MTIISGLDTYGRQVKPKKTSSHIKYRVIVHFSFTPSVVDKEYKSKRLAEKRIATIMNSETLYTDGFSYCQIEQVFV